MKRELSGRTELPYLNNLAGVLVICAINIPLVFLFRHGKELQLFHLLWDAAICGMITALTSLWYARWAVNSQRAAGNLPAQVPLSPFMQRLPRNLFLLILMTGVAASALLTLITFVLIRFFPETEFTFWRFLVWKIIHATILAALMIEFGILRYVQPDCARPEDPPQQGEQTVRNPLPRREILGQFYNSVTADVGMNALVGLLLGGTAIQGSQVIIYGVEQSGVWISGLVLGLIVSFLMVRPTLAGTRQVALAGGLPPPERPSRLMAALPEKPWILTGVLVLPIMIVSAVSLWGVLRFFGFVTLHFFQFFVIRTAYVRLLSKAVQALAYHRYRQMVVMTESPVDKEEEKENV